MAYSLTPIHSKNYWNRTVIVKIIVGGWVVYFLRHSVLFISVICWPKAVESYALKHCHTMRACCYYNTETRPYIHTKNGWRVVNRSVTIIL